MNPQVNEYGAFYIWIAQEVSTGEILGSYTQKTQAIKHAQSFVGGDESEIISDNSLETVFIGGNIAKVTKDFIRILCFHFKEFMKITFSIIHIY